MQSTSVNSKNLFKFIAGSAFGALMFLVPIPYGESFTTLLEFCKNSLKGLFGGSLVYILCTLVLIGSAMSVYDYLCKPNWIRKNHYFSKAFSTTPFYLVSKVLGAVVACMVVFGFGPEFITSIDTGATMVDLAARWYV